MQPTRTLRASVHATTSAFCIVLRSMHPRLLLRTLTAPRASPCWSSSPSPFVLARCDLGT